MKKCKGKDRQDNAFNNATVKAFASVPDKLKKSFTVDNGKEFAAHKDLTDATGMGMKNKLCKWN